jgi:hypothetical protein
MKNFLKNALTVALLTVFVVFALGSDGSASTPSSSGGGGTCPTCNGNRTIPCNAWNGRCAQDAGLSCNPCDDTRRLECRRCRGTGRI